MSAAAWTIGCDPDTRAAHLAAYNPATGAHFTMSADWPGNAVSPGRRLIECRAMVVRAAEALCVTYPPITVAVELPIAFRRPNPPLMMHAGVIAEALGTASALAPWFITVGEWRNAIGLAGNCDKAEVVEWARGLGWSGGSMDQAEALGVAVAAAAATREVWDVAA